MDVAGSETPTRYRYGDLRLAGFLATAVATAILWVASALWLGFPFPPTALAEAIIRAMPGAVATFFIELLQHWAQRLLALGVVAATLVFGGEVLVRTSREGKPRPLGAGLLLALLAGVAISLGPGDREDPLLEVLVLATTAVAYSLIARRIFDSLGAEASDPSRRRALRMGVGGALGVAAGGGLVGWLAGKLQGPDTNVALVAPKERAVVPERPDFPDIPGLSPEITSAEDHYVVDVNLVKPSVGAEGWTLEVFGEVAQPMMLDFESLQSRFEVVEEYAVLTCISNEVGGRLIGNSLWGGVRLADVLDAAGVNPGAVDVVFTSEEGYTDSIPVSLARDPSVLLAVSQNSRPLTQEHGFPCRVRIPSIYGMKNVKWLRKIEVVGNDYKGYWQQRGWSDVAEVHTQSRIDVAGEERRARVGQETWVAGVAWAGNRGISKVEVSTDGGDSWSDAMLKEPISPYAWTLWAVRWKPATKGRTSVMCRATDGEGATQTPATADPHPSGATGYHVVEVKVA